MVTLKDISRETGKSVTQVSRALGGHEDVNPDTRRLIQEAAARMGYQPNLAARGLKTGRTGIVAMVVPGTIDASARENMFEIVTGISAEISRHRMKFVLHVCQPGEDELEAHETLFRAGGIDGFVVLLSVAHDPRVARLMERKIPFVVHGIDPGVAHPGVDVDNFQVGYEASRCLVGQGHQNVVFLNGPAELIFSVDRARGFLDGMGAAATEASVQHGEMTVARGEAEGRAVLTGPNRPTAIVAGNTMLAKGVYQAADQLGLSIPGDLSVLAHDDGLQHYPADGFSPPLGGTQSTLEAAWVVLAERLKLAILDGPATVGAARLPFRFSPGGSLAAPSVDP